MFIWICHKVKLYFIKFFSQNKAGLKPISRTVQEHVIKRGQIKRKKERNQRKKKERKKNRGGERKINRKNWCDWLMPVPVRSIVACRGAAQLGV